MGKLGEAIKYCTDKIDNQDKDSAMFRDIRDFLYELDEHRCKQGREVTSWH